MLHHIKKLSPHALFGIVAGLTFAGMATLVVSESQAQTAAPQVKLAQMKVISSRLEVTTEIYRISLTWDVANVTTCSEGNVFKRTVPTTNLDERAYTVDASEGEIRSYVPGFGIAFGGQPRFIFECTGPGGTVQFGGDTQLLSLQGTPHNFLVEPVTTTPFITFWPRIVGVSADPSATQAKYVVELLWSTQNVTSCYATGGWSGVKPTSNGKSTTQYVVETASQLGATTYGITCLAANGGPSVQQSAISVPAYAANATVQIAAILPRGLAHPSIFVGDSVTIIGRNLPTSGQIEFIPTATPTSRIAMNFSTVVPGMVIRLTVPRCSVNNPALCFGSAISRGIFVFPGRATVMPGDTAISVPVSASAVPHILTAISPNTNVAPGTSLTLATDPSAAAGAGILAVSGSNAPGGNSAVSGFINLAALPGTFALPQYLSACYKGPGIYPNATCAEEQRSPSGTYQSVFFAQGSQIRGATTNSVIFTTNTTAPPPSSTPFVTTIDPASAGIGELVTITGGNFQAANNTINIGTTYVNAVASADGKTLSFNIPVCSSACGYSPIVQACGLPCVVSSPGSYLVSVTNALGTSNKVPLTLTVPDTFDIFSPTVGQRILAGSPVNIQWQSSVAGGTVNLYLDAAPVAAGKSGPMAGLLRPFIKTADAATLPYTIATSVPNSGSYTWNVPADFTAGNYVIRIVDAANASRSKTGPAFSIAAAATAPPTLSFSISPTSVPVGQKNVFTWASTNATTCLGGWSNPPQSTYALQGTSTVGPYGTAGTYTFTITCTGPGGSVTKSVTMQVTASTAAPTLTLTATPTSVYATRASTLKWSTTNATSCTASGAWTGAKAVSGSVSTGALSATKTYTLTCKGAGGSIVKSVKVTVMPLPPPPTLTLTPSLLAGVSVVLSWTSTGATRCTASNTAGVTTWSGAKALKGTQTVGTTGQRGTYYLTCYNAAGVSVVKTHKVCVAGVC